MKGLLEILRRVDEAVFPPSLYCICCGAMIDNSRSYSLCDDCIRRIHWNTGVTCALCGKALPERLETGQGAGSRLCYNCMVDRPLYERGFSCVTYGLHEREIMMDLKYAGKGYLARICGDMMFDLIEGEISEGQFSSSGSRIDYIVPVPADGDRVRERGYNQSALMADQLAKRWRRSVRQDREHRDKKSPAGMLPPVFQADMLYRTRKTRKLRSLTPAERAMELEGTFDVRDRYREKLNGSNVLLIDDIYTTGATANACTRVLLDAGASKVFFLSWASGGNRRPSESEPIT